jgi:hypothetical protein
VYYINEADPETMPPKLAEVFTEFQERVNQAEERGKLPNAVALMHITDWQKDLKRVLMRIEWTDAKTGQPKNFEHEYFLHVNRRR